MEGYKAFGPNWMCRDFQYEIGKTYELKKGQTLEICKCGFHFCKNPIDVFGYYPMNDATLIAKVEALGDIQQEGTKYVTDKIKIVGEFTREELQRLISSGRYNSRDYNSGDYNSGSCNSGSFNSGCRNSGHHNSGDRNSGDCNSGNSNSGNSNSGECNLGDHNSGSCNAGRYNSGYYNSGNHNSGNYNSGDYNTGIRNSGNGNSGHCNSGHRNSGVFNSGNHNSGIFNPDEPYMRAFGRPTNIRYSEFIDRLPYSFSLMCGRIARKELDRLDPERIKALPNFDAKIFREITGIDI